MKEEVQMFLAVKAVSMIAIIVCALFTVYLLNPELVSAEESDQTSGCCALTKGGESCRYTDKSECRDGAAFSPNIACESTEQCRTGCCISPEGICSFGVSKGTCEAIKGYKWEEESACTSEECAKGCCIIGDQCKYTTKTNCDYLSLQFPIIQSEFKASSPEDCAATCEAKEQGCCVSKDTCTYTTADVCSANGGKFSRNTYCAAVEECECKAKDHKECVGEDVYWFDSCGNKEAKAQDCNYESGTLCGYDEKKRDYVCKSVNCASTYSGKRNIHDAKIGGSRENGESWCLYESPVGENRDRPGSRHYRAICINGEEIIEPCRDFRQEVCVQNPLGKQQGKREARCIQNEIYSSPVTQEVSTVPLGNLWDDPALKEKCEAAKTECPVVYYHPSNLQSWTCASNCECKSQAWTDEQAEKCRSAGDCGAGYALTEVFSGKGFYMSGPYGVKVGNPKVVTQYYGRHKYAKNISSEKMKSWKVFGVFGRLRDLAKKYEEYKEGHATPGAMTAQVVGGIAAANLALFATSMAVVWEIVGSASAILGAIPVAGWVAIGVVVVVSAILTALSFSGEEKKTLSVTANCEPWQPPKGGEYCHLCDLPVSEGGLAFDVDGKVLPGYECTKYKCKSLGTGCEFIEENVGTGRQTCFFAYEGDVNSPKIKADKKVLSAKGYKIKNLPNGYEVVNDLEPYQNMVIAIYTEDSPHDTPTQCKLSEEMPDTKSDFYDMMPTYLPDPTYGKYHNVSVFLMPDTEYKFFISCIDKAGNFNKNLFVVKAHTKGGKDITPPMVVASDPPSMNYGPAHNLSQIVTFYLNEPAECKWDFSDTEYRFMKYGMLCNSAGGKTSEFNYSPECKTMFNITEEENTFYVRCKDMENNTNAESYVYTLFKSKPLEIVQTAPSGTIYSDEVALQVMTAGGSENGRAVCSTKKFVFFETNNTVHTQPLSDLQKGNYSYAIACFDSAGNTAFSTINFTIDIDEYPPEITSLHYINNQLVVELNENADCQYSDSDFSFGSGSDMPPANSKVHTASGEGYSKYYVLCKDIYGNIMPVAKIFTPMSEAFA